MDERHGLDYYDERPNGIVAALCVCGEEFAGTGGGSAALELLRAHFEVKQPMPPEPQGSGSVRVILAHTTDASGLKGTVVVGPFMTTYEVLKARHELQLAGAECEVASLQPLAQWQHATQPAERAEAPQKARPYCADPHCGLRPHQLLSGDLDTYPHSGILPCGCPASIVRDEGHQEGCELR